MLLALVGAAAQFGGPGVAQLHRALNAALARHADGGWLARNVTEYLPADGRIVAAFDAQAPLATHCENCDVGQQTFPRPTDVPPGTILHALLTAKPHFTVLVNTSQDDAGTYVKLQLTVLGQLLNTTLAHYGHAASSELLQITYADGQRDLGDFDFYVGLNPQFNARVAALCHFLPPLSGLLTLEAKGVLDTDKLTNRTFDLLDKDAVTNLASDHNFVVVEGTLHQDVLTALFEKYGINRSKIRSEKSISGLKSNVQEKDIIFGDFWMLRSLLNASNSFQQLVQVDPSIRKDYYMSWGQIYTGLEQYVDADVLETQLGIRQRDYGDSSQTKFTPYLGNGQLLQAVNKAIEAVLTQSYDTMRFPFSTLAASGRSVDDYVKASTTAFGAVFHPDTALGGMFDVVPREAVIPGGALDQVLYTGRLLVGVPASSKAVRLLDFTRQEPEVDYEVWMTHMVAMVLSQQYGVYVQAEFVNATSDSPDTLLGELLGQRFDYTDKGTFLRAGNSGDVQEPRTHLVQAWLGQTVRHAYSYQFSYPYLRQPYGVLANKEYTAHSIATQACSLSFVCQSGSRDYDVLLQLLKQSGRQLGQTCQYNVLESQNPGDSLAADVVYFADLATLRKNNGNGAYTLSELPLTAPLSYAARLDAFVPFSVKDGYGRAMGAFSLVLSLALLLLGAVVLVIYGAGKK